MLHVACSCCTLHVARCMLPVACCMLHAACCMLHVACCRSLAERIHEYYMLHAPHMFEQARCMSHVACRMSHVTRPRVARRASHVVCCMPHVACCMLRVACQDGFGIAFIVAQYEHDEKALSDQVICNMQHAT